MIYNTTNYDRLVNIDETVLVYRFEEDPMPLFRGKITFETEDSNAAPEPSAACRIRNHNDLEFTLIYLQVSKKLIVSAEVGVGPSAAANEFIAEFPELEPYREYVVGQEGYPTNEAP